jgi:hypothetical protein
MKKKKKSHVLIILLACLLLPTVCMLPMRAKFKEYTKEKSTKVRSNKILWEKRFNNGAMVIFPTAMLWIFFVTPLIMVRENAAKKEIC